MNLRNHCLRYTEYQGLYADSPRLQAALCNYYATIVIFCQEAVQLNQKQGEFMRLYQGLTLLTELTLVVGLGLAQLTAALWKSSETNFRTFQDELKRRSEEVREEICFASEQAAHRERQLQAIERSMTSRYRLRGDLQRHEEREWRMQMNERKKGK